MSRNNTWHKVRVVVELSVRGNYTDEDLRRDLSSVFNGGDVLGRFPRLRDLNCGAFRVASFNRVQAASVAKNPAHAQFTEARRLTAELGKRISQLESDIDYNMRNNLYPRQPTRKGKSK
jgi:hypothetical protein